MTAHLRTLAIIHCLRALCGLFIGGLFIYSSDEANILDGRYHSLEPGDLTAFVIAGTVVIALSIVRGWHGGDTLVRLARIARRRARGASSGFRACGRVGLGLAVLDFANIALFPISTACGVYGWLVYRHPDTRDLIAGTLIASEDKAP